MQTDAATSGASGARCREPEPTSSPSGARSSSACARTGSSRSRTSYDGRVEIATVRAAHEELGRRRGDRGRLPGRGADRRPARARARRPSSTSSTRSGRIQVHARARRRSATRRSSGLVGLDLGDIIGVDGRRVQDARAASSRCAATGWTLLAKSLRPPPDKFHGVKDTELRYRHRELDLIANPEARELFRKRGADDRRDPRAGSTTRASSRSRRRSCSRSTAARWRARS